MPFAPTPLSRLRFRHQESRYQKRQTKQYAEQQRTIKALARPDQAIAPVTPSQNNPLFETKKLSLNQRITTLPPQPIISDETVSSSKINPRFTLAQQYLLLWHILANLPISQAHLQRNHAWPSTPEPTSPRHVGRDPTADHDHAVGFEKSLLVNASQYSPTLSRVARATQELQLTNPLPMDQLTQMTRQDPDAINNCLPASQAYTRINKRLLEWIKDTAIATIKSPADTLGAVLNHYDALISDDFFASFDICTLDKVDLRYIDEAALLYDHLQYSPDRIIDTDINKVRAKNMQRVRKNFLQKLIPDLQKQALLEQMLSPSLNNQEEDIYFDGLAIRNAFGKTIDDLLLSDAIQQIPQFKSLANATQLGLTH